jgi:hypothetical protein
MTARVAMLRTYAEAERYQARRFLAYVDRGESAHHGIKPVDQMEVRRYLGH